MAPARPFRPRAAALALACAACGLVPAHAADYSWTGGAGSGASFWDLAANWSPGLPAGTDARLLLGAHHTTLRSGLFDVGAAHGTGRLLVQGGELRLNGAGSNLDSLHFAGGVLKTPGTLTVRNFHWDAGDVAPASLEGPASQIVVTGDAVFGNSGGKYMDFHTTLQLQGRTRWIDGASQMALNGGLLTGSSGRFEDHAHAGGHELQLGRWRNEGTYVKTGQGTTSLYLPFGGAAFDNAGRFLVHQGTVSLTGSPVGEWRNSGDIEVARGAALSVSVFRYPPIEQSGAVRVWGEAHFSVPWSGMNSTGRWYVAERASLKFSNDQFDERSAAIVFDGGAFRNDGTLMFEGGITHLRNGAAFVGNGVIALSGAAVLNSEALIEARELRTGGATDYQGFPIWGSVSAPALRLRSLDWDTADLHVPGRIWVVGNAKLHGGPQWFTGDGSSPDVPGYRKVLDGWLTVGGHATWSGETDLVGSGRLTTTTRRQFIDQTAGALPTGFGTDRPVQLGVARFENYGTYLKTGAGAVDVTGRFENRGVVRTQGSGALVFTGVLDNRAVLEARGGRIDVRGSLAQWSAPDRRLTAGAYVVHGNAIGIDLGSPDGIARNSARIELHGGTARLLNNHGGTDRDALGSLALNDGTLRLLHGAGIATVGGLENRGTLTIGDASLLDVGGRYRQTGSSGRTWLDGVLQADAVEFAGGLWGAGLEGAVGSASLLAPEVALGASRLNVDIATIGVHDVVSISGAALLGGTLFADFDDAALAEEGLYRVLTASGGLSGSFSVLTNLDPTLYSVSAIYGSDHVDLQVTRLETLLLQSPAALQAGLLAPVPEPETYALMLAGVAVLWARARRQRRP